MGYQLCCTCIGAPHADRENAILSYIGIMDKKMETTMTGSEYFQLPRLHLAEAPEKDAHLHHCF